MLMMDKALVLHYLTHHVADHLLNLGGFDFCAECIKQRLCDSLNSGPTSMGRSHHRAHIRRVVDEVPQIKAQRCIRDGGEQSRRLVLKCCHFDCLLLYVPLT